MFDVGRVCVKTAGREAGKYCAIVKKIDANFVEVTGPKVATGVRRRKCNIEHLEPLPDVIEIKSDASDSDVLKAMAAAKIFEKLKLEAPTAEKVKAYEAMKAEKAVAKPAKASEKKEEKLEDKKIGDILKEAEKKAKPAKAKAEEKVKAEPKAEKRAEPKAEKPVPEKPRKAAAKKTERKED